MQVKCSQIGQGIFWTGSLQIVSDKLRGFHHSGDVTQLFDNHSKSHKWMETGYTDMPFANFEAK